MKPPAFQFYADDFLAGTFTMSNEERGLYITLLCRQWTQGHVTADEMARLSDGMAQPLASHVFAKFKDCGNGEFKNDRMEIERDKQASFRANRSESGKLGANRRWHSHSTAIAQPMASGMAKHSSPSPSPSPLLEREREFPEIPPMSRKDYDSLADLRGIPKDCAEWFWNACDGRNWTDKHGQPIRKVEPLLINAAKNWRAIETSRKQTNGKWQKPEQTVDDILKKLL